jgi:hypothetical protein
MDYSPNISVSSEDVCDPQNARRHLGAPCHGLFTSFQGDGVAKVLAAVAGEHLLFGPSSLETGRGPVQTSGNLIPSNFVRTPPPENTCLCLVQPAGLIGLCVTIHEFVDSSTDPRYRLMDFVLLSRQPP